MQYQPRWKPDGQEVLFLAQGGVYRVPQMGGRAQLLVSGGDGVAIDTPFFTRQVTYILAIIAIVVAVLALGLGAIALRRTEIRQQQS